jgi:ribosomal protein S17E
MIKKTAQQMIDEYYNSIKGDNPGMTREQVAECCMPPFIYLKREIESGELPTIRLKYLGVFLVYPKRATALLANLTERFKDLKLNAKTYFELKAMLEKFINKQSKM